MFFRHFIAPPSPPLFFLTRYTSSDRQRVNILNVLKKENATRARLFGVYRKNGSIGTLTTWRYDINVMMMTALRDGRVQRVLLWAVHELYVFVIPPGSALAPPKPFILSLGEHVESAFGVQSNFFLFVFNLRTTANTAGIKLYGIGKLYRWDRAVVCDSRLDLPYPILKRKIHLRHNLCSPTV